ncbi:MAG TPA: type IV toxin-antitoxin system AbiEi family antitoxin domain-containing protein, partial [Acidimicrobiia bacterium]|nr:type IV toxin-antitoxin system AbiEi family antitoxin domain-containing protein [Acidimicrobiia bacterium]
MHPERAIALVAESQHGLVTREQAQAAGLSYEAIRGRLRAGLWERLHQGVYRLPGVPPSPKQQVMGACLAGGTGAVASHQT